MKRGLRRVAAVAVATLVVAPALATVASATPTFAFDRLEGADRYATSVEVGTSFGASTDVILANGTNTHTVDALSAAYLAGFVKAPILLTQLDTTPADVVAAITASGATKVWIVGGTGAISTAQETALDAKFGTVTRLGGDDRYLTAEKIMAAAGVAKSTTALLATGNNFPDALGAGPLSYVKGMPVALTGATLPAATLRALKAAGTTKVIALGGTSIVTAGVLAELATNNITLDRRIYGADRAETSSNLADYMITSQGFSPAAVNVASGDPTLFGADALGGAALSGKENVPTLITDSATVVGTGIMAFLTAHAATLATGHIFGGLGAIAQSTQDAMETAAQAATHTEPPTPQTITVTPTTPTTLPAATYSSTDATTYVQYTATVPAGVTSVDIRLAAPADVTMTGGTVSFTNATGFLYAAFPDTNGQLGSALIWNVNGGAQSPTTLVTGVSVIANTVTFRVGTTGPNVSGSAIPVVYVPSSGHLLTNASGVPTGYFGIGGEVDFTPAEFSTLTPNSVAFTDGNADSELGAGDTITVTMPGTMVLSAVGATLTVTNNSGQVARITQGEGKATFTSSNQDLVIALLAEPTMVTDGTAFVAGDSGGRGYAVQVVSSTGITDAADATSTPNWVGADSRTFGDFIVRWLPVAPTTVSASHTTGQVTATINVVGDKARVYDASGTTLLGTSLASTSDNPTVTFDVAGLTEGQHIYVVELGVVLGGTLESVPALTTTPVDEVQTVTLTGTGLSGTFTLTYDGQTTTDIPFDATYGEVDTALAALDNIGTSANLILQGASSPWTVTFTHGLGARDVAQMTADATGLSGSTPGVRIDTTTTGVPASSTVGATVS